MTEFQTWLNKFMEQNHYTQEALGEILGVSHVTVGKWLNGKHLPNPPQLRKLIEISGADPLAMLVLAEYIPADAQGLPQWKGKTDVNPRVLKIMRRLEKLDDEALDTVYDIIRLVMEPRAKRGRDVETQKTAQ